MNILKEIGDNLPDDYSYSSAMKLQQWSRMRWKEAQPSDCDSNLAVRKILLQTKKDLFLHPLSFLNPNPFFLLYGQLLRGESSEALSTLFARFD